MTTARALLAMLLGVGVAQYVIYAPRLPDVLVSNFAGDGSPNGWSSKTSFFAVYYGGVALLAAIFLGMRPMLRRLPTALINVPNRDYWLSPERREETLAAIDGFTLTMGVATMAFMVYTMQLVIEANLAPVPRLPATFMWVLGAFMLFTLAWTARLITRFRRPL